VLASKTFDWLVAGAPGAAGPASVVEHMAQRLLDEGIPLARAAGFVRTLHPSVMGRSFVWKAGVPGVDIREAPYAFLRTEQYARSPVGGVFATGTPYRRRLDGSEPLDSEETVQFASEGYTDLFVLPLLFLDGTAHAISFATRQAGGFRDDEAEALARVSLPLSRVAEILALRRTAANLLDAYVGRDAGERILRGNIQRGDTETIRCALWFSDLRGFTRFSSEHEPGEIIQLLNRVFDCQVPAVDAGGGQVLKFMGDGMLAIFPIAEGADARAVCAAALAAAKEAFAALDTANAASPLRAPMDFGIALHIGDVAYGNIGGLARLDFTCIGPAVNLAARIETLSSELHKRLLVSEAFAAMVPGATRPVGSFPLKGLVEPQRVFEPLG
jgi:adenylate cyclase